MPMQKDDAKGTDQRNYRPMTRLPTTWKLLSGIIANMISRHVESNGILTTEQKGVSPESRGTKAQLLIDKTVCSDSKKIKTNLAMAWIDFPKRPRFGTAFVDI